MDNEPGMSFADIPDDFHDTLASMLSGTDGVREEVAHILQDLRESNSWLDRSLADPLGAPILTEAGSLPGPTTRENHQPLLQVFEDFAADYQRNSSSPEGEKKESIERFHAVVMDVYLGNHPDPESIQRIWEKFDAGDVDPITLLPLLRFKELKQDFRYRCLQSLGDALDVRPCSSVTKLLLVSSITKSYWMPFTDRVKCAEAAIESAPDFLRTYRLKGLSLDVVILNAGEVLNPAASIDYLKTLLRMDRKFVPDHLRHFLIAGVHLKIATRARGTGFINSVSEEDLKVFSDSSEKEALHLLKAWSLEPSHPIIPLRLLNNELTAGTTPLSVEQWYRVALTVQSDSRTATELMTRSLQPRWGGSMAELTSYTKQLIEIAKSIDTRLLYDIPLSTYLNEESWCMNIARETDFDDSIISLLDSLAESNGGTPDKRFEFKHVAGICRILWDASELDRLNEFLNQYQAMIDRAYLYEYLISPDLLDLTLDSRKKLPDPAWDRLHEELIVGPEHLDDERLITIEDSMVAIRQLVAEHKSDTADKPTGTGTVAHAPSSADDAVEIDTIASAVNLLGRYERLYQRMRGFHHGETVDLIAGGMVSWTNTAGGTAQYNTDSIDIKVHCRNSRMFFFQPLRFAPPAIFELDVDQIECDADPYGIALYAGPLALNSTASKYSGRSLRYAPGYPMIMQDRLPSEFLEGTNYIEQRIFPVPKKATLRIEVWKDGTRSYVNGELVGQTDYAVNTGGYIHMGRWAGNAFGGVPDKWATYKITGLRAWKFDPAEPVLERRRREMATKFKGSLSRLAENQQSLHYEQLASIEQQCVAIQNSREFGDSEAENHWCLAFARGIELALDGNPEESELHFDRALSLEPELGITPGEFASAYSAMGDATAALSLARSGKVAEALERVSELQNNHPGFELPAKMWNSMAWFGGISGFSRDVAEMAEKAVQLERRAAFVDTRGLVRAINGDIEGAIDDFQFVVDADSGSESFKQQRRDWMKSLDAGQNPFTADVLEELSRDTFSSYQSQ